MDKKVCERFEYGYITIFAQRPQELEKQLQSLGANGWEACFEWKAPGGSKFLFIKRRIVDDGVET